MNKSFSPLIAASIGVLLVGLWLIVLGISNAIWLPLYPSYFAKMHYPLSAITFILFALFQTLPLWLGIALFRFHRAIVQQFFIGTLRDRQEQDTRQKTVQNTGQEDAWQDTWSDMRWVSTLALFLLGLFLIASRIGPFCADQNIQLFIIGIDYPNIMADWHFTAYVQCIIPIAIPLIFGVIFIAGAVPFGNFIGKQIENSLAPDVNDEPEKRETEDPS